MADATKSLDGRTELSGRLSGFVTRGGGPPEPIDLTPVPPHRGPAQNVAPTRIIKAPLKWRLRNWLRKLRSGELSAPVRQWLARRLLGKAGVVVSCTLSGYVDLKDGTRVDYGVLGHYTVLTAGKNFLAACMDNTSEPEVLKYHAFGTGTTASAAGDTALQTELTTQYASSNTRPTGSQTHSTNTYTTAGTLSPTTTVAVTEWGLASQAANSGGTFLDRQVFAAINLTSVDSVTLTYVFTFN